MNVFGVAVQALHTIRRGAKGVSLATWTLTLANCGFWSIYGLKFNAISGALGSILMIPFVIYLMAKSLRFHPISSLVRSILFFLVLVGPPGLTLGWGYAMAAISSLALFTRLPQIVELIKERDASGVSSVSQVITITGSTVWVLYWLGLHKLSAALPPAATLVATVVILILAVYRHATFHPSPTD